MQTATDIRKRAGELAEAFEVAKRADGEEFYRLRDGSPEWMTEAVRAAHGDMFPDDWRYKCICFAAEAIAEQDDPDDGAHEFADSMVDVYTGQRFHWLASKIDRAGYCDQAMSEGISYPEDGIVHLIGCGQYEEASEVFHLLRDALASLPDES